GAPPIVLIASVEEHPLVGALERRRYAVVQVQTGALAVESAPNSQPDASMLAADLPDMAGIDASRLLHADLRIGHNVPILIIATDKPTPEQRVAALRAGAWDFVRHPGDPEEVALKLQTYVQAKRNIDVAFAEGLIDPATGLHSRPGLARRARELGALMARTHGGLACVVFMLESDAQDMRAAGLLLHTARASDVVGSLGPGEFAVLAPATDHAGAVKLAHRAPGALHDALGRGTLLAGAAAAALSCGDRSPLGVTPGAARPRADLLDSLVQTVNKAASLLTCSPLAADSATQTIGADGGTIYVGPHTLTIPPGALADTVTITAVAPADTVNRVQFQPQGLTFNQPASLTMS